MADYVIQPGDTLSKIAKMTGTTVEQLQKLNGIKNANLIFAGKTIQIPDIESDQAFDIQGLSVEKDIPKGEIRTVYAYIPPEDEKKDTPKDKGKGGDTPWYEWPKGQTKLLYGYICPGDKKDDAPTLPKDDGGKNADKPRYELPKGSKIVPMYGYVCPGDGDDADDGVPPLLRRPKDDDIDDGGAKYRLVYAYIPPRAGGDDDVDVKPPYRLPEPGEEPKITATAKDIELLEKRGASKTANDPNGRAQFVVGDEAGEVSVTGGTKETPTTITIKDDTNGGFNEYTYHVITDKAIAKGVTDDGIPIPKDLKLDWNKGPYYILIKAEDHEGNNLKTSHTEVYRLEYTERDDGTRSYDLIQDEGMDGSGKSSIDYRRR